MNFINFGLTIVKNKANIFIMQNQLIRNTYSIIFNLLLLVFLLLGIQNSNRSKTIKFLNYESIQMPISFIVGTSFISGSILGTIVFSLIRYHGQNQKEL